MPVSPIFMHHIWILSTSDYQSQVFFPLITLCPCIRIQRKTLHSLCLNKVLMQLGKHGFFVHWQMPLFQTFGYGLVSPYQLVYHTGWYSSGMSHYIIVLELECLTVIAYHIICISYSSKISHTVVVWYHMHKIIWMHTHSINAWASRV